ncbi:hypothetical protein [Photorhabdus caribbeanensis]|uniref:hypothetical protein n=1 Tax=Photorhabdus caribbeanensis TaxID=1004165 RepID=UPI001BD42A06|nr:hypothetical protein [Photorhabdus caribbeanensis]
MNHYFSFGRVMVRIGGITGEQTLNIYPLRSLNIDQVQKQRFHTVICRHSGAGLFIMGDLGLVLGLNQLQITQCVTCVKIKNIWDRP